MLSHAHQIQKRLKVVKDNTVSQKEDKVRSPLKKHAESRKPSETATSQGIRGATGVDDRFHSVVDPKYFDNVNHSFIEKLEPFLEGLFKHYFRCEVTGWENMPENQALFVGNHNGVITFEVLMLFYAWWKRYGSTRKALGLAHNVAIYNPFFKWLVPKIGAIPASQAYADEAFRREYSLLVFPGGEKESFRPYSQRDKVQFYQRKGFIKVALRNKVPIVPIVSAGAHESYVILHQGEELAKALGIYDRFRVHGLPITVRSVFFYWCLVTGVFTFFPLLMAPLALGAALIPLPAKMTFRILEPVDVVGMYDSQKSEEENLQIIYDHIVGQMQAVMTEEYAKRQYPILG